MNFSFKKFFLFATKLIFILILYNYYYLCYLIEKCNFYVLNFTFLLFEFTISKNCFERNLKIIASF